MPESQVNRVAIQADLLDKPEELGEFLETLYLAGGHYELKFQMSQLQTLEKAFDQIIAKHGLKGCNFVYKIDD